MLREWVCVDGLAEAVLTAIWLRDVNVSTTIRTDSIHQYRFG
jgi:hypothetical protein